MTETEGSAADFVSIEPGRIRIGDIILVTDRRKRWVLHGILSHADVAQHLEAIDEALAQLEVAGTLQYLGEDVKLVLEMNPVGVACLILARKLTAKALVAKAVRVVKRDEYVELHLARSLAMRGYEIKLIVIVGEDRPDYRLYGQVEGGPRVPIPAAWSLLL